MPDREKVINYLESEIYRAEQSVNDIWLECVEVKLLRDALALLKEQEAVKPVFDDSRPDVIGTFHCGACHSMLGFIHPLYCPHCGRAVKWNA